MHSFLLNYYVSSKRLATYTTVWLQAVGELKALTSPLASNTEDYEVDFLSGPPGSGDVRFNKLLLKCI